MRRAGRLNSPSSTAAWSRFNPNAPLLTQEDIAEFQSDQLLQVNLLQSLERLLGFLGLAMTAEGKVVEAANFADRAVDVWSSPNHNWLRITRILRSLRLLGLEEQARALYDWLHTVHQSGRFPIPAETFRYWRQAAEEAPAK